MTEPLHDDGERPLTRQQRRAMQRQEEKARLRSELPHGRWDADADRARLLLELASLVIPAKLAGFTSLSAHCILASNIGSKVLTRLGVGAGVVPVDALITSQAYRDASQQAGFDSQNPSLELVEVAPVGIVHGAGAVGRGWDGHLIVVTRHGLLDFNLGSMSRPERQMPLSPGAFFPLDDDRRGSFESGEPVTWISDAGVAIAYTKRSANRGYLHSVDWNYSGRELVDDCVQEISAVLGLQQSGFDG